MFLLRVLLFPFALLYDAVTRIRNRLYDQGLKPSARFDVPVICVGNLTVGGTGKTPVIEHLVHMLHINNYKVATLSRGYKRVTKGIRIATPEDNALTLGDEPYQLYRKFDNTLTVSVGEDRALAIPTILQHDPDIQAVLLDDAFQHRRVSPWFNILLTDYHRPFYKDWVLPAGRLREARIGADRADVIVVTKCPPAITEEAMMKITHEVRHYAEKPIFFAGLRYGDPVLMGGQAHEWQPKVVLVTGIANAQPLVEYVRARFSIIRHFKYPDHHRYTERDIRQIRQALPDGAVVLTTEKDSVKIDIPAFHGLLAEIPFFFLPVEVYFMRNGEDFDALVKNAIHVES